MPNAAMVGAGIALCAVGALWKIEEEEDGRAVAMAPFLAALAIEWGFFCCAATKIHWWEGLTRSPAHCLEPRNRLRIAR